MAILRATATHVPSSVWSLLALAAAATALIIANMALLAYARSDGERPGAPAPASHLYRPQIPVTASGPVGVADDLTEPGRIPSTGLRDDD